jgi:hypothetical protein
MDWMTAGSYKHEGECCVCDRYSFAKVRIAPTEFITLVYTPLGHLHANKTEQLERNFIP